MSGPAQSQPGATGSAVPFPEHELTNPPDAAEVALIAGAVANAVAPGEGLTPVQRAVLNSMCESLLGVPVDLGTAAPVGPEEFAEIMRPRGRDLRTRVVHAMLLGELLLSPLPVEVTARVETYAARLGVGDDMIDVARDLAHGSLGLATIDFERCGYFEHLRERPPHLGHAVEAAQDVWKVAWDDRELYGRWMSLETCPDGSLGLDVWRFYVARGFAFPGGPESAPPHLAQHDWIHVLAGYGSSIESESEVFALIARANQDLGAFSLLAMVLSLFETGYFAQAAGGFFSQDRGHVSRDADRMGVRLGDAMARGKGIGEHLDANGRRGESDLLAVDWFVYASESADAVRARFGLAPKSRRAVLAGSTTPWEPAGMTSYQNQQGHRASRAAGRGYQSFGATQPQLEADPNAPTGASEQQ